MGSVHRFRSVALKQADGCLGLSYLPLFIRLIQRWGFIRGEVEDERGRDRLFRRARDAFSRSLRSLTVSITSRAADRVIPEQHSI